MILWFAIQYCHRVIVYFHNALLYSFIAFHRESSVCKPNVVLIHVMQVNLLNKMKQSEMLFNVRRKTPDKYRRKCVEMAINTVV